MIRIRVAMAVLTCCLAGCSSDPAKAARRFIQSGDRYTQQGRYKDAAIEYRNAIKLIPQSVEAHTKLADVSAKANDAATAISEVLRLAELKPDDVAAQVRAGSMYLLAGRFADARDRAESALRVDRADAGAHILLGQALAGLRDTSQSEASLREAVRLAPQSVDAHVALGSHHWSAGRLNEAEGELHRAIEIDPSNAAANRALALLYMVSGRAGQAEPLWKAVSQAPNGDPFALTDYYVSQGRLKDAERELRGLGAKPALTAAAQLRLAGVLYSEGDRHSAHETVNALLARDSGNGAALLLRTRFLFEEQKLDEALAAAQAAEAADPLSADAVYMEGQVHAAKGNAERAVQTFQSALKLNPKASAAATAIAQIRLATGHADEAIEWANRARTAEPDDLTARIVLTRALLHGGQLARAQQEAKALDARLPAVQLVNAELDASTGALDKAERTLKQLVESDRANLQALTALGQVHVQQGHLDAARDEFARVVENGADQAYVRTMMAMIFQAQNRPTDARREYEQVLAKNPRAGVAANNLAWINLEDRRLDDALRYALIAKEELRRSPEVNDTLGWIYYQRNQAADAIAPLAESVDARPDNPLYRYHLAMAYLKTGSTAKAREHLDRALAASTSFSGREDAMRAREQLGSAAGRTDVR